MATVAEEYIVQFEADTSGLDRSLAGMRDKITSFGEQLAKSGAVMMGAFGGAIAYVTKSASDLNEAINKVDVVFGQSAKSVEDFSKSAATNLGLARTSALDYAGSLGNMFVSMKLSTDAAAEFSKGILSLAADVASFNNIGVDDALMKLKSGLQGEAEPLRSVGVLLSDATIKAKAMEMGIKTSSAELSEQQKVLLRYLTILDQTKVQQGDFARTATGMANSTRILVGQFEDLTTKIGEKFSTAANTAIGVVVQMLSVFNNLPPDILAAGAAVLAVEAALGAAAVAIGGVIALLGGPLTAAFIGAAAWAAALAIGISQNWQAVVDVSKAMGISVGGSLRGVVVAVGYVVDVISAATRQVIMAFDTIVNGGRILAKAVWETFKALGQSLGDIIKAILSGNIVNIATAFSEMFSKTLQGTSAAIGDDMKGLANRLSQGASDTMAFLGGKTAKAFGAAFDKGIETAKSFDFESLRKKIEDELRKLTGTKKIKDAGKGMGTEFADGFKDGLTGFQDAFNKISGASPDSIAKLFEPLKGKAKEALKDLSDAFKAATPAVNDFLREHGIATKVTTEQLERLAQAGNTTLLGYTLQWMKAAEAVNRAGVEMAAALPVSLKDINALLKAQGFEIEVTQKAWAGYSFWQKANVVALGQYVAAQQQANREIDGTAEHLGNATEKILGMNARAATAFDLFRNGQATFAQFAAILRGEAVPAIQLTADSAENLGTAVESMAERVRRGIQQFASGIGNMRESLDIRDEIDRAIADVGAYGEQLGLTGQALEDFVEKNIRAELSKVPGITKEQLELAIEQHKRHAILLPGIWEDVFNKLGSKAKSWAASIFGVLDTIPGKFGDMARKVESTISTWIGFFDRILALVHRFNSSIPESIEAAVQKIAGVFQKHTQVISDAAKQVGTTLDQTAKSADTSLHEIGHSLDESGSKAEGAAGKWVAAIGSIIGALTTFIGTRGQGKLIGVLGGAAAGAQIGALFGGLGAAIGAGVGAIAGLLGSGKSAAQKKAEEDAAKQAAASAEETGQRIVNSYFDGLSKALDFLNKLDDFTSVRKAKFREFFAQLTRLINWFVDLSKQWATTAMSDAKAFAESLGPIVDAITNAPLALTNIGQYIPIAQTAIDSFFDDLARVLAKFTNLAESIANDLQKRARKFAERVQPVTDVLKSAVEGLAGILTFKSVPADAMDAFGESLRLAVLKMTAIADSMDQSGVKAAARFAERADVITNLLKGGAEGLAAVLNFQPVSGAAMDAFFESIKIALAKMIELSTQMEGESLSKAVSIANAIAPIAAAVKAWAEAAGLIQNYTGVASDTWDKINADFHRAIDLMNLMLASAIDFLPKAIQFEDVMKQIAAHLKGSLDFFSSGLTAAASSFGAVVGALEGGVPIGGGTVGATSFSITQHIYPTPGMDERALADMAAQKAAAEVSKKFGRGGVGLVAAMST